MSLDAAAGLAERQPVLPVRAAGAKGAAGRAAADTPGDFSQALSDADRRAEQALAGTTDAPAKAQAKAKASGQAEGKRRVGANESDNDAGRDAPADAASAASRGADPAVATLPAVQDTPSTVSAAVDPSMLLAQGAWAARDAATQAQGARLAGAQPGSTEGRGADGAAQAVAGVTSAAAGNRVMAGPAGLTATAGRQPLDLPSSGPRREGLSALAGSNAANATNATNAAEAAAAGPGSTAVAGAQRLAERQDDLRALLQPGALRAAAMAEQPVLAAVLEAGGSLLAPRAERTSERMADGPAVIPGSTGAGAGASASPLFAPVDAAGAAAPGTGAGLAERMVEQVSWWLSQKTQGAEMTLDVANGQTVTVSVQVQGNEAQVAFRSDQAEVRQMLGQAEAQLKDMLGGQGLTLAGMSVGTQSGAAGQASQGQSEGRREAHSFGSTGISAAAEAVQPVVTGLRAPSGRSLDLYV